jgi:hypothetical protein
MGWVPWHRQSVDMICNTTHRLLPDRSFITAYIGPSFIRVCGRFWDMYLRVHLNPTVNWSLTRIAIIQCMVIHGNVRVCKYAHHGLSGLFRIRQMMGVDTHLGRWV